MSSKNYFNESIVISILPNISLRTELEQIRQSPDKSMYMLLFATWSYNILVFIRAFACKFITINFFPYIFLPVIYLLFLLPALPSIFKHIKAIDFIFLLACILTYVIQYAIFPQNTDPLNQFLYQFSMCALPYFVIGIIIDIKKLDKLLYPLSILIVILQFIYSFIYSVEYKGSMYEQDTTEEMDNAYMLLPYAIYTIWGTVRNRNLLGILTSILAILLLIAYGVRGPVVCIVAFIVLLLIFYKSSEHKCRNIAILILVSSLLFCFQQEILEYLYILLQRFEFSTRIVEKLMEGTAIGYANSSGRDEISQVIWSKITDGNILGHGIGGSWQYTGYYTHNIVLDFLVSFGPFIGSILFVILLIYIAKAFIKCEDDFQRGFIILLISCGFLKLFISYIYYAEPFFFLLLGYSTQIIRKNSNTLTPSK